MVDWNSTTLASDIGETKNLASDNARQSQRATRPLGAVAGRCQCADANQKRWEAGDESECKGKGKGKGKGAKRKRQRSVEIQTAL